MEVAPPNNCLHYFHCLHTVFNTFITYTASSASTAYASYSAHTACKHCVNTAYTVAYMPRYILPWYCGTMALWASEQKNEII